MRTYWELIAYPYSLKLPHVVENRVYRLCMRHKDLCVYFKFSLIYSKLIRGTTNKQNKLFNSSPDFGANWGCKAIILFLFIFPKHHTLKHFQDPWFFE